MRNTVAVIALLCAGCASYVAPGGPAPLQQLEQGENVSQLQPVPSFPARIAVARVQAPKYASRTAQGLGKGAFSVVSPQEWPNAEQVQAVESWPAVDRVLMLDRSLLPERLGSLDDLRLAAAKMQADVVLIYTLDTSFQLGGHRFGPNDKIPLGKNAGAADTIVAAASAVLADVRTGYMYGRYAVSEQLAGLDGADWASEPKLDEQRLHAERQAFAALLSAVMPTWKNIAGQTR